MPSLILTIGSCGSGKSTWAKAFCEKNPDYMYVSQDEQGKDGHFKFFKGFVYERKNIVVDRMNFDYEQRKRYIEYAKAHGYECTYRHFFATYEECYNRMMNRMMHPTIKNGDSNLIRKVLDFYWKSADTFNIQKELSGDAIMRTPKFMDITNCGFNRILVTTDPHGCKKELDAWLAKVSWNNDTDLLLIMGDLSDRGYDSAGVIKFATETKNVITIMGNHDCVKSNSTEILTKNGFISASLITKDDEVAQFDEYYNISFSKSIIINRFDDDGYYKLYANKNNLKYEEVSKNHNVYYDNKLTPISNINESSVLTKFNFSGKLNSPFLDISSDELRFIVQIVMDGTLVKRSDNNFRIQFKLSKSRKIERLKTILHNLNINYTLREATRSEHNILVPYYICIYSTAAKYYFNKYFKNGKTFPDFFKYLNKEQLMVVIDEISNTDGSSYPSYISLSGVDKNNINIIQEACIYNNIDTHFSERINAGGFKNSKPQYRLTIFKSKQHLARKIKKEWINETTNFTAIQMPLETLITRTKGSISFTGNCKLIRWLKGNGVHIDSMTETIKQLQEANMVNTQEQKDALYMKMMSFPYIVKLGDNYFTHAGFHPNKHPENNTSEFCMYARHFDTSLNNFTRYTIGNPFWYEVPRLYPEFNLFFGHEVREVYATYDNGRIHALDGGACFGYNLRGAIFVDEKLIEIVEVPSSMPMKVKKDESWDHINKFDVYEDLVKQGYLRKQEKGNLVLYNYSEKCQFEKFWNAYTLECRGIILNKETGDTVARPFKKFFNYSELISNAVLSPIPFDESFIVEDKLDGSMGTLYKDPADGIYKIATRGSFESDQAKIGTEILHDMLLTTTKMKRFIELESQCTPIFEIIYRENRFNDGARLVCDYGSTRTIILLAMLDKVTGKDVSELTLMEMSNILNCQLRSTYTYTIDELVALQKTLPLTIEGFVIKFSSGFRMKIKGDEYCAMAKILNSISPISIWEKMNDSEGLNLSDEYLSLIPEEIRPEVEAIQNKLLTLLCAKAKVMEDLYMEALDFAIANHQENPKKGLGIYKQTSLKDNEIASGLFLRYDEKFGALNKYLFKLIRPTGNILE